MFSDDCLWSEHVFQLPGLARSRQQCGHQSDGWRLRLNNLCHGSPWGRRLQSGHSAEWPRSQGLSPVWSLSDHQTWAHPTLLRNQDPSSGLAQVGTGMGRKEANSQARLPIPLIQQKVTGIRAHCLCFVFRGRQCPRLGPAFAPALNTLTRTPNLQPLGHHRISLTSNMYLSLYLSLCSGSAEQAHETILIPKVTILTCPSPKPTCGLSRDISDSRSSFPAFQTLYQLSKANWF